jgi:hypothetical protein
LNEAPYNFSKIPSNLCRDRLHRHVYAAPFSIPLDLKRVSHYLPQFRALIDFFVPVAQFAFIHECKCNQVSKDLEILREPLVQSPDVAVQDSLRELT